MTKDELKRELKQSQGDPLIRGRRRAKHAELISVNQIMQETSPRRRSSSTTPPTSPWRCAIAPSSGAPIVVAKGVDHVALKIREVADAHDVPMVDTPPLARALHGTVDVGQMIPEAFFVAVAETLAFVWSQRGGARGRPERP